MRTILTTAILFFFTLISVLEADPVRTENAEVELISEQKTVQPGETFWVGVRMDLREGWHVYWRNPGDSGMPLLLEWMNPEGFEIGEIQWPYPEWIDVSGLTSYGYHGEKLFMMEATAPEHLADGEVFTLMTQADWLICEKVCIPEFADIELTLTATASDVAYDERWQDIFAETRQQLPVKLDYWNASASFSGRTATLQLSTDAFELPDYQEVIYFAKEEGEIENGADQPYEIEGNTLTMQLEKSTYKSGDIERLWGLLYNPDGWDQEGRIKAMVVDVTIGEEDDDGFLASAADSPLSARLLIILGFAFLGGMILNLMPCVFPILSIKVMNFMEMSGHKPGQVRLHGLMFGSGVLLSFLVLAGLLLGLRAGGQELGWGFQLQNPAFIAFMTFLMFGLGLSLMGVFEIGNSLINVAGKAGTNEGLRGSFFSGILATVLATPCTAPFMGTALGVAVTLPAVTALLVFLVLGLGMATPYVLLSMFPPLMKYLPKPGDWMETFKQVMAFPLFATAIWLMWVFGQQVGIDGLTRLMVGLLLFSIGIWIIHRWHHFKISSTTRLISRSIAAFLMIGGLLFSAAADPVEPGTSSSSNSYGVEWQNFSTELVSDYREQDRIVFIDFTAAWCITCKANERIIFSSSEVKQKFNDLDVVMVKADWTNRNPEITRALESYGRNGVPLYVLYNGTNSEPMILPEILSPGIVLNALNEISGQQTLTQVSSN
jgi:thiol:disulfide interchange protein/DsbC/DsbD-like thiol-disulfide interchange protein